MRGPNPHTRITRRAFAAIPLAIATPGIAAITTETPIAALFRDWSTLGDAINAGACDPDRLAGRCVLIAGQIAVTPARDRRDWIMKVIALTDAGETGMDGLDPGIWSEARALIGGA